MPRTVNTLDLNLEPQADPAPVRAVTANLSYDATAVVEPAAGPTATLGGRLTDAAAKIGDAVFTTDASNDFIRGTDAADMLYGGGGNDLITGGLGDDTLHGDDGDDTLLGDDGNDTLYGDNGADWLLGGAGNDQLFGGDGDDTLEGGLGDDRIEGGLGNNIMKGGEGNDTLVAGGGFDTMIGGAGSDTFVVQANGHYYGGLDRITDFETGTGGYGPRDRIDLHEALKTSTFTGHTIVEAIQQGYIYMVQHGTPGEEGFGTTIYLDRNGSASDYGYHHDVALVDLVGIAKDQLHVGYYGGNFLV